MDIIKNDSTIGRLIIGQYVDTTFHRKLEAEKVRWEQHGLELTGDHIDWAEEYATGGRHTFFGALELFFDQLWAEMNSVPDSPS